MLHYCLVHGTVIIFTGRNEVVAKVMFLQASVVLSTGGCVPQCMLGYHTPPPQSRHPPGADTPGSRYPHPLPPEQTPPGADPQELTPPGVDPPGADTPPKQAPAYGQ